MLFFTFGITRLLCLILLNSACIAETVSTPPFFQFHQTQPYHLSIGAVLFDQQGRIACHHFNEIFGHQDIYILMRESMEDDETPLMTLHRGLKEEFGATAKPIAFLGCLSGHLPYSNPFNKTTLYVACQVLNFDPESRDLHDPESSSTIEWIDPYQLIDLMQKQGTRFQQRVDADESEIIKRALPYLPNVVQEPL